VPAEDALKVAADGPAFAAGAMACFTSAKPGQPEAGENAGRKGEKQDKNE
jgi:hypothetical protein